MICWKVGLCFDMAWMALARIENKEPDFTGFRGRGRRLHTHCAQCPRYRPRPHLAANSIDTAASSNAAQSPQCAYGVMPR